jgi:CHRD domain
VFLCSNLDNASTEAQPCPPGEGEISGTIMAADVIGPEDQGIAPGEFEEVLDALARRAAYVNVHTVGRPGGEIRGQVASVRKSGEQR